MFRALIYLLALTARASLKQLEKRIVGGHEIDITEAPYQASILRNSKAFCGAVIVGPTTVLTAAHCIGYGLANIANFEVRAGTKLRNIGGSVHTPTMIQCHPISDTETLHSDIAVVNIEPPFRFDRTRQPINLTTREPELGEMVTITGWGQQSYLLMKRPLGLMSVTVPVTEKSTCLNTSFIPLDYIDRNFCAGLWRQGQCKGDSGGPVVRDDQLVGIVSYGLFCTELGNPGASVSLAAAQIYKWLQQAL